jgi:hypothetical protein
VKLTVDSNESLEDAMRVVGALYGVTLVVSDGGQDAIKSDGDGADKTATQQARKATNRKRTAKKKPSAAKAAQPVATAADADAPPKPATAPRPGPPSNVEVRAWARQNGFTVSDRGRVPASVMTAFRNAQDN